MSIHLESNWLSVYAVLWRVYDVRMDEFKGPCFRMRVGRWVFPKRK